MFLNVLLISYFSSQLSDLQKYKHSSPAPDDHVTFEPLLLCPFKTHHRGGVRPKFVPHLNLSSGMSMISTRSTPTSPRVQHEPRFFERPGLLEIPRRIRFIYFWANTRVMQRIIMVSLMEVSSVEMKKKSCLNIYIFNLSEVCLNKDLIGVY